MKKSTEVSKDEKDGFQDEGDPNKNVTQRKIKNAKSKPKGRKRAYKFVGDRAYSNESDHEQ